MLTKKMIIVATVGLVAMFASLVLANYASAQERKQAENSFTVTPDEAKTLRVRQTYPEITINTNQEARAELLRIQASFGTVLVSVAPNGRTTLNDLLKGTCSPDALYTALVLAQKDFIPSRPDVYPPTGETGGNEQQKAETAEYVRKLIRECAPSR